MHVVPAGDKHLNENESSSWVDKEDVNGDIIILILIVYEQAKNDL